MSDFCKFILLVKMSLILVSVVVFVKLNQFSLLYFTVVILLPNSGHFQGSSLNFQQYYQFLGSVQLKCPHAFECKGSKINLTVNDLILTGFYPQVYFPLQEDVVFMFNIFL